MISLINISPVLLYNYSLFVKSFILVLLAKADDIGARGLVPVLEIVFPDLSASLECIPHCPSAIHHQANVMDTLLIGTAVTQAGAAVATAEEDSVSGLAFGEWYFPSGVISA